MTSDISALMRGPLRNPEKPAAAAAPAEAAIDPARAARLRQTAEEFESVFIAQMLKHSGYEKALGPELGAYSQFMLNEIGAQISANGGFGLADEVYEVLLANGKATDE